MSSSAIFSGEVAELRLRDSRLGVADVDKLYLDIMGLLRQRSVRSIVVDMRRVDLVDNSLVNVLRALSAEARKVSKQFTLRDAPPALGHVLNAPSFRMRWALGMVPAESEGTCLRGPGAACASRSTERLKKRYCLSSALLRASANAV